MAGFDFKGTAKLNGEASHQLRAYEIHDVIFEEAKIDEIEIKHGDRAGEKAKVIKTRFVNDRGSYYEETTWFPTSDEDGERKPNQWGGYNPSNFDRAKMFIVHVLSVINPDGLKKLQALCEQDKIKTFDQFAEVYVKLANAAKGFATKLKLVGKTSNGNVSAALPFFCKIVDDQPKMSQNFLGEKLGFSPSELQKKTQYENAKPTQMNNEGAAVDGVIPTPAADKSLEGLDTNEMNDLLNNLDSDL